MKAKVLRLWNATQGKSGLGQFLLLKTEWVLLKATLQNKRQVVMFLRMVPLFLVLSIHSVSRLPRLMRPAGKRVGKARKRTRSLIPVVTVQTRKTERRSIVRQLSKMVLVRCHSMYGTVSLRCRETDMIKRLCLGSHITMSWQSHRRPARTVKNRLIRPFPLDAL